MIKGEERALSDNSSLLASMLQLFLLNFYAASQTGFVYATY